MEGGAEETGREDIGMRRMKDDVGKETGKGRGGRESLLRDQIDKNASSLFLKKKKQKNYDRPTPPAPDVLLVPFRARAKFSTSHCNPKHLSQDALESRPGLPALSDPQRLGSPSRGCQGHHDLRPQRPVLVLGEGTGRLSALQRGGGDHRPATVPWALTFLSAPQGQVVTFRIPAARVLPSFGLS